MTDFKDRERAEEAKFAHDEEMMFRIIARRNRLVGEWAGAKMGLTAAETDAYAKAVVQADFEEAGDEDVFRKISADIKARGGSISDDMIRRKMAELVAVAREQVLTEG